MSHHPTRRGRKSARLLLTGLVAAAMLVVSACTSSADVSSSAGASSTEGRTSQKIAFDYPFTSLGVYAILVEMMNENAAEIGWSVVTTDNPNAAIDRQITNLTGLANSDVAAIITFPMEPAAVKTIMQQAQANGIKWLNYGAHIEGEDGYIDFAGEATARAQVEGFVKWAEEQGIDEGTVLLTVDDTSDLGRTRTVGLREGMAELAPNFTIVEQSSVSTEQGLAAGRAELAKNPHLVAALGLNDDTTVGLAQAFKEAGFTAADRVYVGGNDGSPQVLQALRAQDSVLRSTVVLDMAKTGQALIDMPVQLVEGTGDGRYVADFELVWAGSPEIDRYLPAE